MQEFGFVSDTLHIFVCTLNDQMCLQGCVACMLLCVGVACGWMCLLS
jgi:hypothetical protein